MQKTIILTYVVELEVVIAQQAIHVKILPVIGMSFISVQEDLDVVKPVNRKTTVVRDEELS